MFFTLGQGPMTWTVVCFATMRRPITQLFACKRLPLHNLSWFSTRAPLKDVPLPTFSPAFINICSRHLVSDQTLPSSDSTRRLPRGIPQTTSEGSHDIVDALFLLYPRSLYVRAQVHEQLFDMICKDDFDSVISILQDIAKCCSMAGLTSAALERLVARRNLLDLSMVRSILANILLVESTRFGDALLAATYYFEFMNFEKNVEISNDTVELIFKCLLRQPESIFFFCSVAIMRIATPQVLRRLPPLIICMLLEFCSSRVHTTYHANRIFQSVIVSSRTDEWSKADLALLRDATRPLISLNLQLRSFTLAVSIWKQTITTEYTARDIDTVCELLSSVPDDADVSGVISSIPSHVSRDFRVIDELLRIYGADQVYAEKFALLVGALDAPLKKLTLSCLFSAYMKQGNEVVAEKVLDTILRSDGGISMHDFDTIVSKLLEKERVNQSIRVCANTDISISRLGYIKVFKAITDQDQATIRNHWPFFLDLCTRFKTILGSPGQEDVNSRLTYVILKYVLTKIGIRASKSQFIKIRQWVSVSKSLKSFHETSSINFEQFGVPNQFNSLLALNTSMKVRFLEDIACASLHQNDPSTVHWAVDELRAIGIELSEVIKRLSANPETREKFRKCLNPVHLPLSRDYVSQDRLI